MIRTLLLRLLRHQSLLLTALCGAMCAVEVLVVWISSRIDVGPGLLNMMETFVPPEFRELIQAQLGMASFSGAVAFGFRHPFVLTGSLILAIVAATTPAGERESGYLELVLARPITRTRYFTASIAHLVLGAVALPGSLLLGAAIGLSIVEVEGELPWTSYVPSAVAVSALMLAVGGYSLWIAAGARRRGHAVAQAAGWTLAFFMLDALAALWRPLTSVSWLSPFAYCRPVDAAIADTSQAGNFTVLAAVFTITALAALARFRRQDL